MSLPVITFGKEAMLEWNSNRITDHNRSELSVGYERIESKRRMANGTMRKYVVADKRTFSVSWSDLPHSSAYAVDGFWAGQEMENFYRNTSGEFTLRVTDGQGIKTSFVVMFTGFNKSISKRGLYDFWQLDVDMEEV